MTPTSKIIAALVLLVSIGTAAFVLSTSGDEPTRALPLANSSSTENTTNSGEELATPDASSATKEAIKPRIAEVKPVEETREEKRARKRAKGPFLKGRIIDAYGNPIEGALVEFSSWQTSAQGMMLASMGGGSGAPKESSKNTVKTNSEGRFTAYRDKKFGLDVAISIGARGFLVSKDRELLGEDGTLDLGEYTLEPGAIIKGIVVDHNQEPVAGAQVKRTDGEGGGMFEISGMFLEEFGMGGLVGRNQTDDEGRFELAYEEPGQFELTIKHKEYPTTIFESETAPAGAEPMSLIVEMKAAATITGVLENMPADREKVHVYARALEDTEEQDMLADMMGDMGLFSGGPNSKVDSDGTYTLTGLEPGARYELRAIEKGGMFNRKPCSEIVKATAGDRDVELQFDMGATLSFRVIDALTGDPITQLDVRHMWTDGSDMFAAMAASFGGSDEEGYADGRVEIGELRPKDNPGILELRITSPGYLEYGRDNISIATDAKLDIGTIRLKVAPTVRVQVVESGTGKPVARARVQIRNGPEGFLALAESAAFEADADVTTGDAPAMSDLFGSKKVSGKTDSDGWCELPAFEMRDAVLTVRSPKYAEFEREGIRIKPNGTTTLEVSLVRGGEVRIEVRDESNKPVPGALVLHRGPDGKDDKTKTTNAKGQVRFRRVIPGAHEFMAKHDINGLRGMFGNVNFGNDEDEEDQDKWMTIGVTDGGTSRLTLTAPGFCKVEGLVTSNGVALVGATVSLSTETDEEDILSRVGGAFGQMLANGGLNDVTNDRGLYEISSVPAGEYSIVVKHPNRAMPSILKVKLRAGENNFNVHLALTSVEGRVVDLQGDPVMGATVEVLQGETALEIMNASAAVAGAMADFFGGDKSEKVKTGPDGRFVIHGVSADTPIFVLAQREGYASGNSESVTVKEGTMESGLEIELRSSGSILVRVNSTTRGFSMVQATFEGELEKGESIGAKFVFVRNGKATFKDLRAGPWKVSLASDEDETNAQIVIVEAGAQAIADLSGQ